MYGIFTYIYYKNQLNIGKCTSPMDPLCIYVEAFKERVPKEPPCVSLDIPFPWKSLPPI